MISTQKQNFSGWSCAPFSLCYKHWFPAYILCHVLHPAHTLPRNKPLSKPNKSMWDCAWHEQSPVVGSWEGNSRQCLDLILGILSGINMGTNGICNSDIIKNFLKVFFRNHQGYKLGNRFMAKGAGITLHATAKKSTLTNLKKQYSWVELTRQKSHLPSVFSVEHSPAGQWGRAPVLQT